MQSRRILADGTYATESAFSSKAVGQSKLDAIKDRALKPPLRNLILNGDYFVGAALASCLTKLVLRYSMLVKSAEQRNVLRSEAMLMMTSVIRVGKSEFVSAPIDEDSSDRILNCIRVLSGIFEARMDGVFLEKTRQAFTQLVEAEGKKSSMKLQAKKSKGVSVHADDLLVFRQLKSKRTIGDVTDEVCRIIYLLLFFSFFCFFLISQRMRECTGETGSKKMNRFYFYNFFFVCSMRLI